MSVASRSRRNPYSRRSSRRREPARMSELPVATIRFRVNGQNVEVQAHPMSRLLDVLRRDVGLTGTKEGCGEGECGACSILINGELVNSCLTPVLQADGAD